MHVKSSAIGMFIQWLVRDQRKHHSSISVALCEGNTLWITPAKDHRCGNRFYIMCHHVWWNAKSKWTGWDVTRTMKMGWYGMVSIYCEYFRIAWWAPSAKMKEHHRVSSGWISVWHRSNTGLSSTQYEQIPIIFGVWPFWLTPFFFRSIIFWRAYGYIAFPLLKLLSFFWLT